MIQRGVVFIDGSNLYETVKRLGISCDFNKLPKMFIKQNIIRYYYFTAVPAATINSPVRKLVDYLDYNGYTCVIKESREYTENGSTRTKGNMDVELVLTAVDIAPHITDLYLFSGDGDFTAIVKWLQMRGIRVTVFSSLLHGVEGAVPMISNTLRKQADMFVDLADHTELLAAGDMVETRKGFGREYLSRTKS